MRGPTPWVSLTGLAVAAVLAGSQWPVRPVSAQPPQAVFRWQLPPGFPEPVVPADNPMSAAKVALGRHLFYDPRLSGTGSFSCASCHEQARAFAWSAAGRPAFARVNADRKAAMEARSRS